MLRIRFYTSSKKCMSPKICAVSAKSLLNYDFTRKSLSQCAGKGGRGTVRPVYLGHHDILPLLYNYDNILLDCDGVLWKTDHYTPLPGVGNAINKLKSLGKRLYFVTNNSMISRRSIAKKFLHLAGFNAPVDDIFTVGYSCGIYLKNTLKFEGKVYLIGGNGISDEFEELGIPFIGPGKDLDPVSAKPEVLMEQTMDPDIQAVVVAFDQYFCYNKLFKAVSYLSNPDCLFVVTSDKEMAVQLTKGYRQPVTGCFVAAVVAGSKRTPIITGKPEPLFLECIQSVHPGIDLAKTLMIGDSIKTDIPFAKNCGIKSLLVLTGDATFEDVEKAIENNEKDGVPDFVIDALATFA